MTLSQALDSMIMMIHTQFNRDISSAISDRFITELKNLIGNVPLNQNGVGTDTSSCDQGLLDKPDGSYVNLTIKDS